jgi:hypothetical protein
MGKIMLSILVGLMRDVAATPPLPWGEVGAKRRVRAYRPIDGATPLTPTLSHRERERAVHLAKRGARMQQP